MDCFFKSTVYSLIPPISYCSDNATMIIEIFDDRNDSVLKTYAEVHPCIQRLRAARRPHASGRLELPGERLRRLQLPPQLSLGPEILPICGVCCNNMHTNLAEGQMWRVIVNEKEFPVWEIMEA